MTQHSPGPWRACNDGVCKCATVTSDDHPIAKITRGEWGYEYPSLRLAGATSIDLKAEAYIERITYGSVDEQTAIANALLIAAAPAMLAALKGMLHEWDQLFRYGSPMAKAANERVQAARAAIAKAEATG